MIRRFLTGMTVFTLVLSTIQTAGVQAEEDVEKARKDLEDIRKEKKEVKGEIKEFVEKMDQEQAKIEKFGRQIHRSNEKIYEAKQNLKVIRKDLDRAETKFKSRLKGLYQNGEMGYMTSLLESESLSEFLARFETLRLLVKQDRHLVDRVAEKKKEQQGEQARLEELNERREQEIKEAEKAFKEMQKAKEKNKVALTQIEEKELIQEKEIRRVNLLALQNGTFKYSGGPLSWSGKSHRITSSYGYRTHPVTGTYKLHTGIDTAGNAGDPIYAAADGIVLESQPASGYGWIILIDHGSGLTTLYAHMYPHTVRVQKGDYVERGQRIASIGSNGYSTGPHNHFEVRKNGQLQNPLKYLK